MNIAPGVSILGVLSNLNYEPWFALSEYVDNAVQSSIASRDQLHAAHRDYRLHIDVTYEKENDGLITITDNAAGIARADFPRAFRAAEVPPDRSGLSEFGMGMKSASIWFARKWRVTTTSIGDSLEYVVQFDMDEVLRDHTRELEISTRPSDPRQHFTRIELSDLNQMLPGRTLGKVRDHLREIYRSFLRAGELQLTVAGRELFYTEPEILVASDYRVGTRDDVSDERRTWRRDVRLTLAGDVEVTGWAAIRAEGKTSGNGLALFRRGRVISGTSEAPYRPARIYGASNSFRSQRLFGELEISGLPVSHTKDGFQWHGLEEEFEEELRAALDSEPIPLLKQAEHYRSRETSRAEQKRVREAADNTAAVSQRTLPGALEHIVDSASHDSAATSIEEVVTAESESGEEEREFEFELNRRTWRIKIAAAHRNAEPRWLIQHVDVDAKAGVVRCDVVLNTAHPFIKQFAMGSTDAIEVVLRIAVAVAVGEAIAQTAGDGEVIATFLRQVNTLLSSALSQRLKSNL